jgi:hypothetical protein
VKNGFSIETSRMFSGGDMIKGKAALLLALLFFMVQPGRSNETGKAAAEPAGAANPDGLWQKALSNYQKNSDWYPEKIAVLSEVLDRHGQPDSVTQLFFTLSLDTKGRMRTELTRALKNGKDISEEMKKKVEIRNPDETKAPKKEESVTVSFSDSPFNPDRQKSVTFHAGSEKQMLLGHLCQRFDFTYQTEIMRKGESEKLTWTGMAWLEENSGMPLKLEFSLTPLPKRIRSLWTIYLYEVSQPDKWILKKIMISGQGGFLFIKKRFRSTTTFSDYRRQPQKGDEK